MVDTSDTAIAILGLGLITPGAPSLAALSAACASPGAAPKETKSVPPPEGMSARDQRRLARLTRLALLAADNAAAQAGVRGRQAGIYIGLTHGTATFLKEFHDFLFDYGPEMASPNAFSNGVTNAPLGAISLHQKLTEGGATLVGIESCGLEVLCHAAAKVLDGTHELCYAGATEEYSPIVEDVYRRVGWYRGRLPDALPWPFAEGSGLGLGVSEGSVVCVVGRPSAVSAPRCLFTPVDDLDSLETPPDLVVCGAGGGPQDAHELKALQGLLPRFRRPVPLLFSKPFFGETFAVGSLLSLAMAWDVLVNRARYPSYPAHESLRDRVAGAYDPGAVSTALVMAADREGSVAAGLLSRPNA